jgi:hypothetical protein
MYITLTEKKNDIITYYSLVTNDRILCNNLHGLLVVVMDYIVSNRMSLGKRNK